jgi:hypothetical protein
MVKIKKENLSFITVKDTPLISITFCEDKLKKIV